jgi:hypothetical protein
MQYHWLIVAATIAISSVWSVSALSYYRLLLLSNSFCHTTIFFSHYHCIKRVLFWSWSAHISPRTMIRFTYSCTIPPEGVNFVSSPQVRGSLDILWSCVTPILACTWINLHLNVPIQSTTGNKVQIYTRTILRLLGKVKRMLINVLAPEWALDKAWSDYLSVSRVHGKFVDLARADNVPWTRKHA